MCIVYIIYIIECFTKKQTLSVSHTIRTIRNSSITYSYTLSTLLKLMYQYLIIQFSYLLGNRIYIVVSCSTHVVFKKYRRNTIIHCWNSNKKLRISRLRVLGIQTKQWAAGKKPMRQEIPSTPTLWTCWNKNYWHTSQLWLVAHHALVLHLKIITHIYHGGHELGK